MSEKSGRGGRGSLEAMKRELVQEFERHCQIIEHVVWAVGLTTYQEHKQRWNLLLEAGCPPHDAIFKLAMHYLNSLDATKSEHGESIAALGDVLKFTGNMAQAYSPRESVSEDATAKKQTDSVH